MAGECSHLHAIEQHACKLLAHRLQAGGTASLPASGVPVIILPGDGKVTCGDVAVKARVERAVHRLLEALRPVPLL